MDRVVATARRSGPFAAVLGGGLALRLALAYVVFPGQGYAGDVGLFASWAETLARVGPGAFYATASSANYPPGYLYVLWLLGSLGGALGSLTGTPSTDVIVALLKLPPILADVATGALLAWAGTRWFGRRAGLLAAGLYLFIPVTWYDSALWGQVDGVGALVVLAAVVALVEGWDATALGLAMLAVLVKPQDAIALVVVLPILVRRHLLRVGSGPRPRPGHLLSGLDDRLDGLLLASGPTRLGLAGLTGAAALIVPLLPFDLPTLAPASLADVPVIGHVAGLIGLFVDAGGQFGVLTANAYNAWALVGDPALATAIGSGGSWLADSLPVLGGIPAVTIGTTLLLATGLLVAGGLLVRDDRLVILLSLAVVAFAFYALPTRVHERYLFPFFAPAALLAAVALPALVGYVAVGLLNTVNLHAVLAAPLSIGGGFGGGPGGGFVRGGGAGGPGAFGGAGGFGGAPGGGSVVGSISLPFADLARAEPLVTAVAAGQTLAFVLLLAAWFVVVLRPSTLARDSLPVARRSGDHRSSQPRQAAPT